MSTGVTLGILRGLRTIANEISISGSDESSQGWNSYVSGFQGLLDGEAMYLDHSSPSTYNPAEDYGIIDYNFEEEIEAFMQLNPSAHLIPNNYLPTPELSGSSQSPSPEENRRPDFTVNAQRMSSGTSVNTETFCYGMVSIDPNDSGSAIRISFNLNL